MTVLGTVLHANAIPPSLLNAKFSVVETRWIGSIRRDEGDRGELYILVEGEAV